MKDSETVGRITNARLRHTHTHVPAETQCRKTHTHAVTLQSRLEGPMGVGAIGGGGGAVGEMGSPDRWMGGVALDG